MYHIYIYIHNNSPEETPNPRRDSKPKMRLRQVAPATALCYRPVFPESNTILHV